MADTTTADAPAPSEGESSGAAPAPAVELFQVELRIKRYDPEKLAAQMLVEGWELMKSWRYGDNYNVLCLFRRSGGADTGSGED